MWAVGFDWSIIWGCSGWTFSPTVSFFKHTHANKLHTNTNKIISMGSDSAAMLLAIKHYSLTLGNFPYSCVRAVTTASGYVKML